MDDAIKSAFEEAFSHFLHRERNNIVSGVSERNLCGRLAVILEGLRMSFGFDSYYADTEYDRKQGGKIKTILDDEMKVISITCDLIFHSRGELKRDNLLALEMKKAYRPEADNIRDRDRLRAMTKASYDEVWSSDGETDPEHVCGYELGIFVELNAEEAAFKIEEFRGGKLVAARSGTS